MERPRVRSSWALIQVEASFFINTKINLAFSSVRFMDFCLG